MGAEHVRDTLFAGAFSVCFFPPFVTIFSRITLDHVISHRFILCQVHGSLMALRPPPALLAAAEPALLAAPSPPPTRTPSIPAPL